MCLHAVLVRQWLVKQYVSVLAVQGWGTCGLAGQVPCTSWALAPAKGKCWESTSNECRDTCLTSAVQLEPFRLNMPEICSTSRV